MRLSLWKKAAVLGMAFTMTMSLTACGGIEGKKADAKSTEMSFDAKEVVFKGADIDAADVKGEMPAGAFARADDKIYFFTLERIEEASNAGEESDEFNWKARIYSMNTDGTELTLVCEPDLDCCGTMQKLMFDKDKNMIIYSEHFDHKTSKTECYISRIDTNGNVTENEDITKKLKFNSRFMDICLDDNNNYIAVDLDKVYVIDSDYNLVSKIKGDRKSSICNCAKSMDGKIFCGVESDDSKFYVSELDVENKKWGDPVEINTDYLVGGDLLNGDEEYDIYYYSEHGVYGYSAKDKASKMLLDYTSSGVAEMLNLITIDSETMIGEDKDISGYKLVYYNKVDPSDVKDKTVITFGSLEEVDHNIISAASKFNSENDKYKIEFKDYSSEEDPQTKMNADILSGKVPDIIDLNAIPIRQYVSKGLLEDLTPYYEKDEVVKKEDILPSVEKAMEIYGKLYYISTEFTVGSMFANKENVDGKTGWTPEELKAFLNKQGKDVKPFCLTGKTEELKNIMNACIDDYIDWGKGECSFNSDSFKAILEIADCANDDNKQEEPDNGIFDDVRTGKILFMDGTIQPEDYEIDKKIFKADIIPVGYPCEDKNGSYFEVTNKLGIYSKSEVKEGAWEFLRILMTKDYQCSDENPIGTPTNKDAFESYMKTKTATEAYTDEYGRDIQPNEYSVYLDDCEIVAGPLSDENEKMYRDLVNTTTKVKGNDDTVLQIVCEEAAAYFKGKKDLDETAEIIQDRVTTYLNEIQ